MRITVEISLYPVIDDYVPSVKDFLMRLHSYKMLEVVTNTLSTLIVGEHTYVFDVLSKETAITFQSVQPAVFILKVVGVERDIHREY